MFQLNAIRIRQRGVDLYVTAMKASDLLPYARIDYWHENNPGGYQRPLVEARITKAVKYLLDEEGVFPTTILVNIRGEVQFMPACAINGFGELGVLTIPDRSLPLWIIDGQHRIMAINLAAREEPEFENYSVPISILTLRDRFEEMRQFYIVNSRQKAVPTSLAQRHLDQAISKKGEAFVSPYEPHRKVLAAEAVPIVDILRTNQNSPWFRKVMLPNERRKPFHIISLGLVISQTSLADSIGYILGGFTREERYVIREKPEFFASILINYWNALKEIFPEAFSMPHEYTIQKTNGCYVFHIIFSRIYELCKQVNDFSKEKIKEILSKMFEKFRIREGIKVVNSEFWNRTTGHSLAIGTGMKAVKELAKRFLTSL